MPSKKTQLARAMSRTGVSPLMAALRESVLTEITILAYHRVLDNWSEKDKETFARYAYPISSEVYILWDNNPAEWAPQNHSCNANTDYNGLNVVATTTIQKDEELTLNYAHFLDDSMQPFECNCDSQNCIGLITGIKNNSVTYREDQL